MAPLSVVIAILVACFYSAKARWLTAACTVTYTFISVLAHRIVLYRKDSKAEHYNGLHLVSDRQTRPDGFDIVAVHGLGAHPKYTWSKLETHEVGIESRHTSICSKQQSTKALPEIISKRSRRVDWLTDFVPEDFEDASVLKYNHNADWFLDAPKLSIRVAAEKLLTELQTAKREKPIVFVGHSYGGLIVKEAVYIAATDEQFAGIYDLVQGIIFLGTPHQGSRQSIIANLLARITKTLGSNTTLTTFLTYGGDQVTELDHRFWKKWHGKMVVHNLCETRPTFWKGIYLGMIVDIGAGRPLVCDTEVDADHSGLNKCTKKTDDVYKAIKAAISDIQSQMGFAEDLVSKDHVDSSVRNVLPRPLLHIFDDFEKSQGSSKVTRGRLSSPLESQQQQEEKATASSFYVYDYRRAWMNASASIEPGTCSWLTSEAEDFLWWMKPGTSSKLLWLTGSPGTGKTSLTAHVVRWLIDRTRLGIRSNKIEEAVLYSFCDDKVNHTSREILASIIHQFMWAYPIARTICHQWNKTRQDSTKLGTNYGRDREVRTLWRMFCETVDICCEEGHLAKVFLLVDGLDQCSEHTRFELANLFVARSKNLWIMVSSQPSQRLLSVLETGHNRGYQAFRYKHISMSDHRDDINSDLDLVIRRKVGLLSAQRKWNTEVERQVIEELKKHTRGEFLTITFAIAGLEQETSFHVLDRLRDRLAQVTDLESHNDQLIADLPSELRQRQSQILKYVMYTMRPLKVTELAAACGYLNDRDLISGSSDDTNASLDARTKPLMQELSKYGQMLRVSDPDDTVDFSHPSIRKYLVRKSLNLPSSLKPFLAPEHTAKLEIAVTCIGFLKSVSVMKGIPEPWMQNFALRVRRFDEKVPLYSYALRYWDIHIREAIELSTHDLKHKATLLQYLQSIRGVIKSQPHSEFVRQLTNPRGRSMFINPPEVMTDLDFFAAMGISSQVETILGIDYSKPKSALTRFSPTSEVVAIAARSAAHNGHQHTFELLFDLLKPGPYTDQILHGVLENAVHGGDLAIIRRVLRHYTPSPTELIKAVMKAVAAGDSLTLDALQSCEDAMKATDKAGRNVMHHLALRHIDVNGFFDEELFKQAYEYFDSAGVPIRTQDFYGDTPLHHITLDHKKGFEMVIRTLIELGVDPAAKNRRGQTALHFASWRGSAKAVAALLEYVPESQAIGKSAGDLTPLHWAMNRHDYDVNVGTTDSEDGYHVVQALIHLGASFDAKSTEGRTPLTIAAENPDVAALVWRFASAGALDCTLLSACFGQPREAITGSDYPSYIKRDQRISQRVQELDDYDTEQRMESRWAFTKRLTWNSDKLDYESVTDANMIGDLSKEFEEEFRTEEASRGLFWHDL